MQNETNTDEQDGTSDSPSNQRLNIAAIQFALPKKGGLDDIISEVKSVVRRFPWVDMVVFGELATHGASLEKAQTVAGATETAFVELARDLGIWLIPGSLYEKRDGKIYNTSLVINPMGKIIARYDKMFPFLPYEKNVAAGNNYVVFDVPGAGRIGLAICYDMWFPEAMRELAAMGAEAIILPTMTNTVDRDVELAIARTNAAVNQLYFIDVNVGGEQGLGRSVFYEPGGVLLHECGAGHEVVTLELDFDLVRRVRDRGWQGLGQVLKSYRDSEVEYPAHTRTGRLCPALNQLGDLKIPEKDAEKKHDTQNKKPKIRIVE